MTTKKIKNEISKPLEHRVGTKSIEYPQASVLNEHVTTPITTERVCFAKILDSLYNKFPKGFTSIEADNYTKVAYGVGGREILYRTLSKLGIITELPANERGAKPLYCVRPGNMLKLQIFWRTAERNVELGENLLKPGQKIIRIQQYLKPASTRP